MRVLLREKRCSSGEGIEDQLLGYGNTSIDTVAGCRMSDAPRNIEDMPSEKYHSNVVTGSWEETVLYELEVLPITLLDVDCSTVGKCQIALPCCALQGSLDDHCGISEIKGPIMERISQLGPPLQRNCMCDLLIFPSMF